MSSPPRRLCSTALLAKLLRRLCCTALPAKWLVDRHCSFSAKRSRLARACASLAFRCSSPQSPGTQSAQGEGSTLVSFLFWGAPCRHGAHALRPLVRIVGESRKPTPGEAIAACRVHRRRGCVSAQLVWSAGPACGDDPSRHVEVERRALRVARHAAIVWLALHTASANRSLGAPGPVHEPAGSLADRLAPTYIERRPCVAMGRPSPCADAMVIGIGASCSLRPLAPAQGPSWTSSWPMRASRSPWPSSRRPAPRIAARWQRGSTHFSGGRTCGGLPAAPARDSELDPPSLTVMPDQTHRASLALSTSRSRNTSVSGQRTSMGHTFEQHTTVRKALVA